MGRTVVALGLLVPVGPVSALAIRRTRLRPGPVRLGVVPCWHCRAGSGDAVLHPFRPANLCFSRSLAISTTTLVRIPTSNRRPDRPLEQFLTDGAEAIINMVTQLEVVVDGQPLSDLFNYRATSRLFTFTADPSLVAFDPCITGTEQSRCHRWLLDSFEPAATRRAHRLSSER